MSATQANNLSNAELVKIFHRAARRLQDGERLLPDCVSDRGAGSRLSPASSFLYHFALAVMFASTKELAQIRGAALLIIETHQLT